MIRFFALEEGVPPRFRFISEKADHVWAASDVEIEIEIEIETQRADGSRQSFTFVQRDGCIESAHEIPEPHPFTARLRLTRDGDSHDYDVGCIEHAGHHGETRSLTINSPATFTLEM